MKIPAHIAIIMDGNGRWAALRKLPRGKGHEEGAKSVEAVVNAAKAAGVRYLTLYAFSTENWARPKAEIFGLMSLLKKTIDEFSTSKYEGVKVIFSGRKKGLSKDVLARLEKIILLTKNAKKLTVNLALNYGGRQEICDAVNKLLADKKRKVSEKDISRSLYADIPEPDLIIRTSGEQRLSNFLLWQCAYSEFYFTPVLWPDFREKEFTLAVEEYARRKRRFGGTKSA